jgi:hypothetical protein
MEQSFQMQVEYGVAGAGEGDEVKRIFLEGNPVLLAITMVRFLSCLLNDVTMAACCLATYPLEVHYHPTTPSSHRAHLTAPNTPQHPPTTPNQAVSLLHSVFDFLAFKNDVAFWKDNRSMEGLSARSILINAVCQLVILLYLFDNDTSTVVLISSGGWMGFASMRVLLAFRATLLLGLSRHVSPLIQPSQSQPHRSPPQNSRRHRHRVLEGHQGL